MAFDKRTQLPTLQMPTLGLGCWQSSLGEVGQAVQWALEAGVRLIDTAFVYMNEKEIGDVLKKEIKSGKVKREDLFIVTKLPFIGMKPEDVAPYFEKSLANLSLDFIDLFLIHSPLGVEHDPKTMWVKMYDGKVKYHKNTNHVGIWKEMEKLVDSGKCRSIGVSNFNSDQLERVAKAARIPIAVNQVECNAFFQQKKLRETMNKLGIKLMAYAPLGSPGRSAPAPGQPAIPMIMEDPTVADLAKKYNKSPAQVLIRHLVQKGFIVIPKSVKQHRIRENFDVFDFELNELEMRKMNMLDKGYAGKSFDFNFLPTNDDITKLPEYPFIARDKY